MIYENRPPPEHVNVGRTNVVLEFLAMLAGFFLTVASALVVLYLLGGLLGRHIPFSWEARLAGLSAPLLAASDAPKSAALQKLADEISRDLLLPAGMSFRVHYIDDDTVNAFATPGGQILMHAGLVSQLQSENAVVLVLAHEMAHILYRDPADAMGGQLAVALALSVVGGAIGLDDLGNLFGFARTVAVSSFSRAAERRADEFALGILARRYGHLGGATQMFALLAASEAELSALMPPELLSTHPETAERLSAITAAAARLNLPESGKLTPLPPVLRPAAK